MENGLTVYKRCNDPIQYGASLTCADLFHRLKSYSAFEFKEIPFFLPQNEKIISPFGYLVIQ